MGTRLFVKQGCTLSMHEGLTAWHRLLLYDQWAACHTVWLTWTLILDFDTHRWIPELCGAPLIGQS